MRTGEVFALTWDDIDFENKIIKVKHNVYAKNKDNKGKWYIGDTKTETGERQIYICNTLKCRPPENRDPLPEEKAACREYLDAQVELLKPRIILLCGRVAVNSFIDTKLGITKLRGKWFEGPYYSKMMPIFHPSYLLRNDSREKGSPKWQMWQGI